MSVFSRYNYFVLSFVFSLVIKYGSSSLIRANRSLKSTEATDAKTTSIPRILWVNVHRVVDRNNDRDRMFDENIVKAIKKYKDAWTNDDMVDVRTLSSVKCEDAISKLPFKDASTALLKYYIANDPHRQICIIANLYLDGGYYLKRTTAVIDPYIATSNDISFAAVTDPDTSMFESWFLAAAPNHRLLYKALENFILLAKGELTIEKNGRFSEIMRLSFDELSASNPIIKSNMVLLSVKHLKNLQHYDDYKRIRKQDGEGPSCDQVIVDHDKKKAYFYTLFPGASDAFCRKIANNPEVSSKIETMSSELVPKIETTKAKEIPKAETNSPRTVTKVEAASPEVVMNVVKESSGSDPIAGEPAIPRKLWVNVHNLPGRNKFDENIINTIQKYKKAWNNDDNVEVEMLSTETCKNAISKIAMKGASTDLLRFYLTKDPQRSICHIAVLFLYGGYFVQRGVEVIDPYIVSNNVSFAAVTNNDISMFHGSFIASAPYNSLLFRALKKYILLAQGQLKLKTTSAFGEIMRSSFREVTAVNPNKKLDMALLSIHKLDGLQLINAYKYIKNQEGVGPYCNNVIIDNVQKKAHFFAMFVGASDQLCRNVITVRQPTIPHKLWFATREDSSNLQNKYNQNIMNTVQEYLRAWNVENIEYSILDVDACKNAIMKLPFAEASSTLLVYYMKEVQDDPAKGFDICCAAALFLNGGYSFNEELQLKEPLLPKNNDIIFVGVKSQTGLFLPSFVASSVEHPVTRFVLMRYIQLAQGKLKTESAYPAGEIYRDSYYSQKKDDMSKSVILLEKDGIISARM